MKTSRNKKDKNVERHQEFEADKVIKKIMKENATQNSALKKILHLNKPDQK